MSVFEILQGAKFATDSVEVCLRQDLAKDLKELRQRYNRLVRAIDQEDNDRLGKPKLNDEDSAELQEVEDAIEAVENEMAANVLTIHMTGIATGEYNVLQRTAGRPRKDNKVDNALGYNIEAFFNKAIRRCTFKITSPDGDEKQFEEENWVTFLKAINDAQFDDLCQLVESVNRKKANHPTKARSSENQNDSEQNANQLMDLESATNALLDGNLGNSQQ